LIALGWDPHWVIPAKAGTSVCFPAFAGMTRRKSNDSV
jgi:hypothetical protein